MEKNKLNSHETVKSGALGDLDRPFPKSPDEVIDTLFGWYLRNNKIANKKDNPDPKASSSNSFGSLEFLSQEMLFI